MLIGQIEGHAFSLVMELVLFLSRYVSFSFNLFFKKKMLYVLKGYSWNFNRHVTVKRTVYLVLTFTVMEMATGFFKERF